MVASQIPTRSDDEDEDSRRSLELQGLFHALLRHLWLIVLIALLAGAAAWSYARGLPDLYRSTASIEVKTRDTQVIVDKEDQTLNNPEVLETIVQDFKSRSLMERVGEALNLGNDQQFLGYPGPAPAETVINQLLGGTIAELRPRTRLVDVSFSHRHPAVAQKVANALVDQYLQRAIEQRTKAVKGQNRVLDEKAQELKFKVLASEEALQKYKKGLKSGSLESVSVEERRNYVEEKLKTLNTDLATARADRLALESDRDLIRPAGNDPQKLLGIPSIQADPQVTANQAQVSKLETDLAALTERYRDRHPQIIGLRAQLESARNTLRQAARTAPERLSARYEAAQAKENNSQREVSAQSEALLQLEEKMIPYRILQREYESERALRDSVLQKLNESNLSLGVPSDILRVVEPAAPARPLANRRLFIVVGAVAAGALLVSGIIAGLHFLNNTIRTVDTAEQLLGLPVLAAIPTMSGGRRQNNGKLALLHQPNTVAAESFRTLRVALSLFGPKHAHRVFLFTSAVPGEGKSLTALNTAIAFAQQGLRTLVVDADLRQPSLAEKLLGPDVRPKGVGDYVAGTPVCITDTPVPKLSLLAAGTRIQHPAELLSSPDFEELIGSMKESYERVVIDSAPLNVVSDTLSIVNCASVICLVVRSNSTSRKAVQRAVELLRRSGVKLDGIVLNGMPRWKGIDNHYDYSGRSKYGGKETYSEIPRVSDPSPEPVLSGHGNGSNGTGNTPVG